MIKERIIQLIESKGIPKESFYANIGMTSASFRGNAKNTPLNSNAIENILSIIPDANAEWLLTGKGAMLKEKETALPRLSVDQNIGVPYYDVDFVAGFGLLQNEQTIVPTYNIVFKPFEEAQLWCNVTGNSMSPQINPGDIIALKEVNDLRNILYGEIYAVVLEEMRTIKIIRKSSDPEMFRFVPINTVDYDEQEFRKKSIIRAFAVLGSIRKFF